MHSEQVEAIVERTLERYLGDVQTLENLQAVLRKTNTHMAGPDQAADAQNAKLMQSFFLSLTNLARVVGNIAEAASQLQDRITALETTIPAMQEAVLNLQLRVRAIEDAAPRSGPAGEA